ncbi:hypothetical protein ACN8ZM_33130 [Burkholderia aenigmatica]|uniref:hypothetical protein n=1 Tax=Burkholderia aenigmatica TaxID=2015348 RepID=UPI003B4301D9
MLRIALIGRVVPRLLMSLVVWIVLVGLVIGFAAFHGGSPLMVENLQCADVIFTEKENFTSISTHKSMLRPGGYRGDCWDPAFDWRDHAAEFP